MPEVNGNMVEPFGGPQDPPRQVVFDGYRGKKNPDTRLGAKGFNLRDDQLKHDDKKPGEKINWGDMQRLGGGQGGKGRGAVSREVGDCKVTMYLHCSISSDAACTSADIDSAMAQTEAAAKLLSGECPCKPPPPKMRYTVNRGCALETKIVWHPKGKAAQNAGVIDINVVCGDLENKRKKKKEEEGEEPWGPHGWGESSSFKISVPNPNAMTTGAGDSRPALFAHELGHIVFGTGEMAPPGWSPEGHNLEEPFYPVEVFREMFGEDPRLADGRRRERGLMRDTNPRKKIRDKKGNVVKQGLRGPDPGAGEKGDKLSESELCMLVAMLGCDMGACCVLEEIPADQKDDKKDEIPPPWRRGSVRPREYPGLQQPTPIPIPGLE